MSQYIAWVYSTLIVILYFQFSHSQTATSTVTPPNCAAISTIWLAWGQWSTCTDTCGACGIYMRTRVCLTSNVGCLCQGQGTQLDYCSLDICRYPRTTCCFNRTVASYQGRFACLQPTV